VTVGIIDAYASPSIVADANRYATTHGDPAFAAGQYTQTLPSRFTDKTTCDYTGWYGEQTLDVEAVHAMAPGATVHYYGGASCFGDDLDDTAARLVDDNDVDMVSNSYGELGELGESTDQVVAFESIVLQGERQGISFMFSSGDDGDEVANLGVAQPDWSASDPYVTAVGGTSTAIGADGKIAFQTGWGEDRYVLSPDGASWISQGFWAGAGGGFSTLFNRPTYQRNVVPASSPAGRGVPDVAMDADPTTGMLVGETQAFPDGNHYGEYRIGGTSLASPLFTGMQALAQQHAGSRQGFLNPTIYTQARQGRHTFADVLPVHHGDGAVRPEYDNGLDPSGGISYVVRTFDQDSSLSTGPGWDDVTGVGVPTPNYLTSLKGR
jgi:subtilase family serine protease